MKKEFLFILYLSLPVFRHGFRINLFSYLLKEWNRKEIRFLIAPVFSVQGNLMIHKNKLNRIKSNRHSI